MKQIYLLENLDLTINGLCANDESVFLQQGSLDGACGPYCLFMALIILGEVDTSQATNMGSVKGSSRLGKMLKKLKSFEVLIHNGTATKDLTDILEHGFKKRIRYQINSDIRKRELVKFIEGELDESRPVLVTIRNDNIAHWLLAVGYEIDDNDDIVKMFFLDPSIPLPPNQYWNNAVLVAEIYKKKYHHILLDSKEMIMFDDCFSMEKLKLK